MNGCEVLDKAQYRAALGRFVTGVAVVTTTNPNGQRVGLTISSFNSVSLDPPLVLWSLANKAPSLAAFSAAGRFAVNVLASSQMDLALQFSRARPDKFEGVEIEAGVQDLPLLRGAIATFECRVSEKFEGGDHTIFLGLVERIRFFDDKPLVYYRGQFSELTDSPNTRTY
jgi:flavin reductase (DIM6/NTAB) family NADH-FMN oxidoreductase RutF